jgi:hypothetical protein
MAGKDHDHVNPQRAVGKHTATDGIGYSVAKTKAQLNRQMRQEGLRDFLSKQKLIEKVIDIAQDLTDPEKEYDALDVQRMRTAAELNLKLAAKVLPDLKSTELTGADGGDLVVAVQRKRFDGEN